MEPEFETCMHTPEAGQPAFHASHDFGITGKTYVRGGVHFTARPAATSVSSGHMESPIQKCTRFYYVAGLLIRDYRIGRSATGGFHARSRPAAS